LNKSKLEKANFSNPYESEELLQDKDSFRTSLFNQKFMDSDYFHKASQSYDRKYDERVKVWQINEVLDKDFAM
jgi:hypothetical protein